MNPEASDEIRRELGPGETLLWADRPRQGICLRPADALLIPFSLIWGGFVMFWESMVLQNHAPPMFALFGIPFVLVGIYLVVGRFFVDSYQRSRTSYGLTNRRAIIVNGLFNRTVRSIDLSGHDQITLSERGDRSGTITFGPLYPMYPMWAGTAWPGMGRFQPAAFDLIDDVRNVYDQVRKAQDGVLKVGT